MDDQPVRILAWAILAVVLVAEVLDLLGPDPVPGSGIGPLAIIAAGYLFGSRVIRNGHQPEGK